ncbi:MAG: ATP-grasp domain-containing protein [Sedimentisphaerales bacterium]|nr:ATP-grasp domain-containing protein [Sedimentisphaerales bacterium]
METRSLTNLNVGFVYDLRDDYLREGFAEEHVAEFDTEWTVSSIARTLAELGCKVQRIGNAKALLRELMAGKRWDLVFNIAEGVKGRSRESQVPAILELFDIPYTMSDPLVCAATLDKEIAKKLVRAAGLPTPASCVVKTEQDVPAVNLKYPLFAKPIAEGTGKGVDAKSKIADTAQLAVVCKNLLGIFRQPVLVEEYLPGREFTTAILGTGPRARVLGTLEFRIKPDAPAQDYSYEVKEYCEKYVEYFPMPKDKKRKDVEDLALACYRALECRDTGRVDIRLDADGNPSFMEVNPLPGMNPGHSDLPMIATQEGMSYNELLKEIVMSALERVHSS